MKHRKDKFTIKLLDGDKLLDDHWQLGNPCPQLGYISAWHDSKPDKSFFEMSEYFEWTANGSYWIDELKITPENYVEYLDVLDLWQDHPPKIEEDETSN